VRRFLFPLAVAASLLYCLGPYAWQVITSVKPSTELGSLPPVLPSRIDLSHYASVFLDRSFARIILNSAAVASSTTVFCLLVGSLASYAVAKLRVRGKHLFLGFVLSISMFPPIATVSPLYLIIRALGWRDTYLALILPYATFALPLTIWILSNFFREIPDDLNDASKIDGCSPLQTFTRVIFPLSLPAVFTTAILVFIFAWNEFLFALTFTSTERARTIPVGIALFPGLHEIPWGDIAAATIIVTIPLLGLVLAFQRRIISGMTLGAVKG